MTLPEAQAWGLLLATLCASLTTAVVAVIAAVKVGRVQKQAEVIETKVGEVHDLTNSRLSRIEAELTATRAALTAAQLAATAAEQARVALAHEATRPASPPPEER